MAALMVLIEIPISYEELKRIVYEKEKYPFYFDPGEIKGLRKIKVPKTLMIESQEDDEFYVFGCVGCRP